MAVKNGMLDKAAATKLLSSLGRRIATATLDLQKVAISAIGYSIEHGDITIAQRTLEVMGDGMRKQTMVRYFEVHGNLAWNKEAKTVEYVENAEAMAFKGKPDDLYALLVTLPWTDAVKEQIDSILDVAKAAERLIAQIQKRAKDGKPMKVEGKLAELMVGIAKGEVDINVKTEA